MKSIEERAALGARCRELLENPVFREAIEAVDAEFREAVFRTAMEEADKREALFREYHALRRVVHRLRNWEQDGVLAEMEREAQERKAKQARS